MGFKPLPHEGTLFILIGIYGNWSRVSIYKFTEPFGNLKTQEEGCNIIIENSLVETKISVSRRISNKDIPVVEKVLLITTKVERKQL